MKYQKMIGLAAMAAMALMAFFGASSASAAVLCKTDSNPCEAAQDLKAGDTLTASLKSGTHATLQASFSNVTCSQSHLAGKLTSTGGEGKEVEGEVTELTFTECKCGERTAHVTVIEKGSLKINNAGTVTSVATRATIQCTGLGISCVFGTVAGGTDIGTFTDSTDTGSTAQLDGEATLTWSSGSGDSSQFLCAGAIDTAKWTATYQVTSPDSLYLSER